MAVYGVTKQLFQNRRCIHSHMPFRYLESWNLQRKSNRPLRTNKASARLDTRFRRISWLDNMLRVLTVALIAAVKRLRKGSYVMPSSDINGIKKRYKQLVLTAHQFLSSRLEWPQQALGCSGKGSIEISHWIAAIVYLWFRHARARARTHTGRPWPNSIKAHRQRCSVYPSGDNMTASRHGTTHSPGSAEQHLKKKAETNNSEDELRWLMDMYQLDYGQKTKIDVRIVFFSPLIIREYIDIIKSTTMLAAL